MQSDGTFTAPELSLHFFDQEIGGLGAYDVLQNSLNPDVVGLELSCACKNKLAADKLGKQ
jgi:hypothetical protein